MNGLNLTVAVVGAFGFGSWIATVMQHWLEKSRLRTQRLFDARQEVYGKLIGQLRSSLLSRQENLGRLEGIDIPISEAILIADAPLTKELSKLGAYIDNYRDKIMQRHYTASAIVGGFNSSRPLTPPSLEEFKSYENIVAMSLPSIQGFMKQELGIK